MKKSRSFAIVTLALISGCSLSNFGSITPISAQSLKPLAFDVVSIRPSGPGSQQTVGITLTGFISKNNTLWATIMTAYFPKPQKYWSIERLVGVPAWMKNARYDIEAKLDAASLMQWRNLSPVQRAEAIKPILQKMLTERCKLVAHLQPAQVQGSVLTVSKKGIKFKEAAPNSVAPPRTVHLPDGGWVILHTEDTEQFKRYSFFNATMQEVADFIMRNNTGPIVDRTGLKGRYDLDIPKAEEAEDGGTASEWDVRPAGLELKPSMVPSVTVIIDHLEPPTAN